MRFRELVDWNIYWVLFVLAEFSLLAALPYSISITGDAIYDFGGSLPKVLGAQFAHATILFLISIFTGLYLGKKVGLETPFLSSVFEKRKLPSDAGNTMKMVISLGLLAGIIIFILDRFIFSIYLEPLTDMIASPPLWERILYVLYVGLVEELVLRFFLMTLLVWISWKIKKKADGFPTSTGIWFAILIVSFIYGLGIVLSTSMEIDNSGTLRIMIWNGITGMIFGWIYWKKGLEASIIANMSFTFVLLVVLGSLIKA